MAPGSLSANVVLVLGADVLVLVGRHKHMLPRSLMPSRQILPRQGSWLRRGMTQERKILALQ